MVFITAVLAAAACLIAGLLAWKLDPKGDIDESLPDDDPWVTENLRESDIDAGEHYRDQVRHGDFD